MRSPFQLLPGLLILSQRNSLAIADPFPLPEALPAADAFPQPTAIAPLEVRAAEPIAYPEAEAVPQSYYAFSGAVYIVDAGGQTLNAASPAYCPNQAPQGCGNLGVYNWCCPSGNSCAWTSSDHTAVGCCPAGQSCSGGVERSQITTVTVTQYAPTNPTTVVVVGGNVATTTYQPGVQYNGYCSTLVVQNQPGLPTTRGGYPCGTILVVGDASRKGVGHDILVGLGVFYATLGLAWGFFGRGRW